LEIRIGAWVDAVFGGEQSGHHRTGRKAWHFPSAIMIPTSRFDHSDAAKPMA